MPDVITVWLPVPGASCKGHLVGSFSDLPKEVRARVRAERTSTDDFVLFVCGSRAGLVAFDRGSWFSPRTSQIRVEIVPAGKGGSGVSIVVGKRVIARWPHEPGAIERVSAAARFIASQLGCEVDVLELGET